MILYNNMKFTNFDNSHIPIPGFYSNTVPSFGLRKIGGYKGGSKCVQKCVTDCNDNCGPYCKLASSDDDIHTAHLKDLKEINAKLQKEVDHLSSKFLRSHRKDSKTHFTSSNRTSRTPRFINILQMGRGTQKSKKRYLRRKTRKGGLSFWGSTTDIKPCETSCKRECPYQCKTICNRAVNDTLSDEDKKEIENILAQNQNLRNAITLYSD